MERQRETWLEGAVWYKLGLLGTPVRWFMPKGLSEFYQNTDSGSSFFVCPLLFY